MRPEHRSALRIIILGMIAGYVDALAYIALHDVFTAAQTGNTTRAGAAIGAGNWEEAAPFCTVLVLFFLSALFSSVLRRLLPAFRHGWLSEATVLVLIQFIDGVLPGMKGGVLEAGLLAVAMAMQGQTLSRFSGVQMQTIVITTNLLKFADNIVDYLWTRGATGRAFQWTAAFPGLCWCGCFIGAALSFPLHCVTGAVFLVPVPLLVLLSFWRTDDFGN
jgi:uncharacterized membrane protein YoaK (UPF0700 family)